MRHILLGTTAFVLAAGALAAPARAELDVTMGGYVAFQAGFFDNDVANSSDRDFRSKSELRVIAKGTADNGMEYGARVDLLASTSSTEASRRTFIYVGNGYGRVELGDTDGAANALTVVVPNVGIGQTNGSYVNFINSASRPAGSVIDTGGGMTRPIDSDQATKISYFTPKLNGFQAGISYAPEVDSQQDGEEVQLVDNVGNIENLVEVAANYRANLGDVKLTLGGAYNFADAKSSSTREEFRAWGLGARVGYGKFEVGATYIDNGDSNNNIGVANDDETAYTLGGRYQTGPWGFAAAYTHEDYDLNGGRDNDTSGGEYNAFLVGGAYKIAEGLTAGADLAYFERNKRVGTDDDGYVMVVQTKAAF